MHQQGYTIALTTTVQQPHVGSGHTLGDVGPVALLQARARRGARGPSHAALLVQVELVVGGNQGAEPRGSGVGAGRRVPVLNDGAW
jgi:hypothetical protein